MLNLLNEINLNDKQYPKFTESIRKSFKNK